MYRRSDAMESERLAMVETKSRKKCSPSDCKKRDKNERNERNDENSSAQRLLA